MKDNFTCNDCGDTFFQQKYRKYAGSQHYVTLRGALLCCPSCQSSSIETIKSGELSAINIATYSMMSREQKVACLKQRSTDHYNKHIKDKKKHINDQFKKSLKNE